MKTSEYRKEIKMTDEKEVLRIRMRKVLYHKVHGKNETFNLLGCSPKTWKVIQFLGNLSRKFYGAVCHVNHTLPCSSFDLLNDCTYSRRVLAKKKLSINNSYDQRLYLLQEFKAHFSHQISGEAVYNSCHFYSSCPQPTDNKTTKKTVAREMMIP